MKKQLILSILLVSFISSCAKKTRDEIVKEKLEPSFKLMMDDPNSYEFVSLKIVDSTLYKNNIDKRKKIIQNNLNYDLVRLNHQEDYKKNLPYLYKQKEVDSLKSLINNKRQILFKIDSITTKMGNTINDVASYSYLYTVRGKNKFGAKILTTYFIQTENAPNYTILDITDNEDKLNLTPNDFPGYKIIMLDYKY